MKNEMLKNIILSVKSQNKISEPIKSDYITINEERLDRKNEYFKFLISDENSKEYPKYSFIVIVTRIPNSYFFKNWSDGCSRYHTTIDVKVTNYSYSSSYTVDVFTFDSEKDDSLHFQKELFYLMKSNFEESNKQKEMEKSKKYIEELKKTHGKDILRDQKLDKLLS